MTMVDETPATLPAPRATPWEQLPNEPNASYVRFLAYRNLGPCRSIQRAAALASGKPTGATRAKKVKKSETITPVATWYNDSSAWNWKDRAERWDIDRLNDAAERVESAISELIIRLSQKATEALDTDVLPKTFSAVLHAFKELSPHVPQNAGSIGVASATVPPVVQSEKQRAAS
jgi:hypothetical protein